MIKNKIKNLNVAVINKRTSHSLDNGVFKQPSKNALGPAPQWRVEVIDLWSEGLTLELPHDFCDTGEFLNLAFSAVHERRVIRFETTAKVASKENLDSLRAKIAVDLPQVTPQQRESYLELCSLLETLQKEVEIIFERLKG